MTPFDSEVRRLIVMISVSIIGWSVVVILLFMWSLDVESTHGLEQAEVRTEAHLQQAMALQHWASDVGGMYVSKDHDLGKSYLPDHIPDTRIKTEKGRELVLMSPGRMMRHITSGPNSSLGVRERLINYPDRILNPDNRPDAWELAGLNRLAEGATRVAGKARLDDGEWYRMLHPLQRKDHCLTCHADYAQNESDFAGAISVAVDLRPANLHLDEMRNLFAFSYGLIWLVGLVAIGLLYRSSRRRLYERQQYEETLEVLSYQDALTEIANRRMFDVMLEREWARAKRSGDPFSLLMIDIDLFKQYNDNHGHQAGDLCLVKVAKAINGSARRGSDLLARYGGEEFVLMLPNTPGEQAADIARNCAKSVVDLELPRGGGSSDVVSVSIGVATATQFDGEAEALVKMADEALYRAKEAGRNGVVVADAAGADLSD